MKTCKPAYLLVLLLICFDSFGTPLPSGFRLLGPTSLEFKTYQKVREKSIEMIDKAVNDPETILTDEAIAYANKARDELEIMRFAVSLNEQSEEQCQDSAFFVMPAHPNVLFICGVARNALRDNSFKDFMMSVQLIIHEAAHFVDHRARNYQLTKGDECMPTYLELIIMENNIGKQKIPTMTNRDSYKAQCGFEYYDDVPSDDVRYRRKSQ